MVGSEYCSQCGDSGTISYLHPVESLHEHGDEEEGDEAAVEWLTREVSCVCGQKNALAGLCRECTGTGKVWSLVCGYCNGDGHVHWSLAELIVAHVSIEGDEQDDDDEEDQDDDYDEDDDDAFRWQGDPEIGFLYSLAAWYRIREWFKPVIYARGNADNEEVTLISAGGKILRFEAFDWMAGGEDTVSVAAILDDAFKGLFSDKESALDFVNDTRHAGWQIDSGRG